jgi:O-antigen/teichoic acid export membrane protein
MIKKLISASVIYALAPQLPKLVSIFMMPFITAHMTQLDYGITGIIFAYVAALDAFKDLGLRVILTNSFFKFPNRYRWIWKRLSGFIHLWSIGYGILIAILLYFIIPRQAEENYLALSLMICIPITFFGPSVSLGRFYYQYSKKPIPISIISVITGLTTVFANYYFIVIEEWGYMGLIAGQFTSQTVSFLFYFVVVYIHLSLIPSLKFNWKWIKRKLKISLPTVPMYYSAYIIGIFDRVLLDFYKIPIEQIGMYSFAYSFGQYFSIIGKSYQQASGPFYMENYKLENKKGDSLSIHFTRMAQAGMILLCFIVAIWLKEIFQLLVRNDELHGSYLICIIILFSFTYYPSYSINSMKLWYLEKTKKITTLTVVAALTSIVTNLVLIPIIGIWGSAIATFISMMVMGYSGFLYPSIRAQFKAKYNWAIWLLLTVALFGCSFLIVDLEIIPKILFTVVYVSILSIILLLKSGKLKFLHSRIK